MSAMRNPGELLIFGNPKKKRAKTKKKNVGGFGNHKPGCKCGFCKRAAQLTRGKKKNSPVATIGQRMVAGAARVALGKENSSRGKERATRERAEKIRSARLNPKRTNPRRRRHDRKNPGDMQEAVKLFQSFHGRNPKEIVDRHVSAAVRLEYTTLGDLEYLRCITPLGKTVEFNFEGDGVKLASSPDGKQLYCIGGNQDLRSCLDDASLEKDFIDLGECTEVQYLARKIHGKFQPVSYYHEFGEDTGERPQLMWDKLKKQVFFIGGNYFIDTSQGVSPGIEN
jgi:hypothetical protein